MLPDGILQIKKYSSEESKKINTKIHKAITTEKKSGIRSANQFLLMCIKGECRDSINLLYPKTMKALNYNSKHIPTIH